MRVLTRSWISRYIVLKYLRNSTGEDRLNHIMTLYIHKEMAKTLSLAEIANEFVSRNERRMADFGETKFVDEIE